MIAKYRASVVKILTTDFTNFTDYF